jgi:hypothetical protein
MPCNDPLRLSLSVMEGDRKTIRILPALLLIILCTSCLPLASFFPLWDEDHVESSLCTPGETTGRCGPT